MAKVISSHKMKSSAEKSINKSHARGTLVFVLLEKKISHGTLTYLLVLYMLVMSHQTRELFYSTLLASRLLVSDSDEDRRDGIDE